MINLRSPKENKFSIPICFAIVLLLNIELFIYFTGHNDKDEISCEVVVSIVYPNSDRATHIIAQLLNKWKTSTDNHFTIISVPRNNTKGIVIVIPFIEIDNNQNFKILLETISSISNHTNDDEKLGNVLAILFESNFKYDGFIQKIMTEFTKDILIGFLQLIKVPTTDVDNLLNYHQNQLSEDCVNHEVCKSLGLVSTASVYLTSQGSYAWYLNNDVEILTQGFLSTATKFIKKTTKPWSVLDLADHMSGSFTGKIIRMKDLDKFAYFFLQILSQPYFKETERSLYEAHLDYVHLMYQSNFITFKPILMLRRSQIDAGVGENLQFGKWRSNDPSGVIITSMRATDFKHSPMRAYGSLANQYFEASSSKYGDWFAIVFDENILLEKVILELDYRKDSLEIRNETYVITTRDNRDSNNSSEFVVKGILEASPKLMKLDSQKNLLTCGDYVFIGNIQGPTAVIDNLQDKLSGRPSKCLKFTLSSVHLNLSLIIRQIAVFSED